MAQKKSAQGSNTKKGGVSGVSGVQVGVGVAAVAAAMAGAAGAYWLYGAKDAARNRKSVKSFMLKARADVLEAVEKAKDLNKETYTKIVDGVVARYAKVSGITTDELAQMTKDLKVAWGHMQKVAATHGKTTKSRR